MRILVTGGRNYSNRDTVYRVLDQIHVRTPISVVIHGAATGADTLAAEWAREHRSHVREEPFPADWKAHGRAAGPIRNRQMLDVGKPDLVVAFSGGTGTANMVRQARAAGVRVLIVEAAAQK